MQPSTRRYLIIAATFPFLMVQAAAARADWLDDLQAPFRAALASESWGSALFFSFLAGVATALTPCVYPMIAITVSIFGAQKSVSLGRGALLSSSFVLGIAALFTPLGLFAAATGGLFGSALSSPWVLGFLSALFAALAASMFGAFELDLPAGLKTRSSPSRWRRRERRLCFRPNQRHYRGTLHRSRAGILAHLGSDHWADGIRRTSLVCLRARLGFLVLGRGNFRGKPAEIRDLARLDQKRLWHRHVGRGPLPGARLYTRIIPVVRPRWSVPTRLCGACARGFGARRGRLSFHDERMAIRLRKGFAIACTVSGLIGLIGYAQALPPGAKIVWSDDFSRAQALAHQRETAALGRFYRFLVRSVS